MMTKVKWTLVVALLAFFPTGGATTDVDAKLDYQSLKGSWQWDYPVGYNILTIESVTVCGEKVYLLAYHDPTASGPVIFVPLTGDKYIDSLPAT